MRVVVFHSMRQPSGPCVTLIYTRHRHQSRLWLAGCVCALASPIRVNHRSALITVVTCLLVRLAEWSPGFLNASRLLQTPRVLRLPSWLTHVLRWPQVPFVTSLQGNAMRPLRSPTARVMCNILRRHSRRSPLSR